MKRIRKSIIAIMLVILQLISVITIYAEEPTIQSTPAYQLENVEVTTESIENTTETIENIETESIEDTEKIEDTTESIENTKTEKSNSTHNTYIFWYFLILYYIFRDKKDR